MPRYKKEPMHIAVGGHVVAVDAKTGHELWRTKLKGASITTVRRAGDLLYAGAGGELFCLDAKTGSIVWRNKLKGLGLGLVSFVSDDSSAGAAAAYAQQAAVAAAG